MATVHLTLQGKGGVGKSYVASLLAQYNISQDRPLICIDTDPVNATFSGYNLFNVEHFALGETADEVNPRYFDTLMERIFAASDDDTLVIDNGAATFLPLVGYMVENDATELLIDSGHKIMIHSVLTGGQGFHDTVDSLDKIFAYFKDIPIVVWNNEYFGLVEMDGKSFEQSKIYKENQNQIHALIRIAKVREETFGADIDNMLKARLGFEEAIASDNFSIMARQRLKSTWRQLKAAMEQAQL